MSITREKPKAIVFDLLTALIDSWTAWDHAVTTAATAPIESDTGRVWRQHYLELTYGCGAYRPYTALVHEAAALAGLPPTVADELEKNWDHDLKPWPESPETLRRLKDKGYKLGVVTNCSNDLGHRAVQLCENAVGHGFAFDATVTAEEAGFYKPRRQPYEALLAKLGVQPDEALFVAGSSSDVPGAAGVGMKVVWHNRVGLKAKNEAVPEREAATLDEALLEYL